MIPLPLRFETIGYGTLDVSSKADYLCLEEPAIPKATEKCAICDRNMNSKCGWQTLEAIWYDLEQSQLVSSISITDNLAE